MTDRELQIINAIKFNPMISQQELADYIGISRSAIATHMTNLTAKGIIKGRGYVVATEKFSVVIGGANMDIVGSPQTQFIPNTSNPGSVSSSPGGVARNVAENMARLGNKCYLISIVGNDSNGKSLCAITQQAGVDVSQVFTSEQASTSSYLSVIDDVGEMQCAIADMAIIDELTPARVKKQLPLLKQAATIVIDTNISEELMDFLFKCLPNSRFFVDTVSIAKAEKIRKFLPFIHSLKPNLLEAQSLSAISLQSYEQLPELANWFHHKGVQELYISLGNDGLFYSSQTLQKHICLPTKKVLNSNGAGDAMTAALVHGHLAKTPPLDNCYFALAAANLTLASTATNNPTLSIDTVSHLLKDKP